MWGRLVLFKPTAESKNGDIVDSVASQRQRRGWGNTTIQRYCKVQRWFHGRCKFAGELGCWLNSGGCEFQRIGKGCGYGLHRCDSYVERDEREFYSERSHQCYDLAL